MAGKQSFFYRKIVKNALCRGLLSWFGGLIGFYCLFLEKKILLYEILRGRICLWRVFHVKMPEIKKFWIKRRFRLGGRNDESRVLAHSRRIFRCGLGPVHGIKRRPTFRLIFSSAGARTRTWSLLVRSQTLYPVGLHPRFVFVVFSRWRVQI